METLQERFQGPEGDQAGRMDVFRLLFGALTQEREP